MGLIRVTPAELRQRAEMINEMNIDVKNRIEEFDTACQALAAQWEGEARDAFVNAYTQDKQQMEYFVTVMDSYYQTLLQIADNYDNAEMRNAGIANTRTYGGGGGGTVSGGGSSGSGGGSVPIGGIPVTGVGIDVTGGGIPVSGGGVNVTGGGIPVSGAGIDVTGGPLR